MANPVVLRLQLNDVYGNPLKENVDVIFRHLELSEIKRATVKPSQSDIGGLRGAPQGDIESTSIHRPISTPLG